MKGDSARGARQQLRDTWRRDPAAIAAPALVFLFALFTYTRALGWGLPSGDETWAGDALRPSAPLAVAYHSFAGHGWNSGWFWFKYPPFHAYLLCALYAPYLAWLWLTGGIHGFASDYPFGMKDPVASLSMLALIGRAASAVMGAGSVVAAYQCVVRSFGRAAACAAAFVVTLTYPMVFYSQTTNVEVPYLFWMMLALLAAVRIVERNPHADFHERSPQADLSERDARAGIDQGGRTRWWILLGIGAALAISTKELVAGAFVGLPFVLIGVSIAEHRPVMSWIRGGLIASASFAVAMAIANNALYNPLGFAQRLGFLTQTLPREIALKYAPYYFPIDLGGSRGLEVELAQLRLAVERIVTSLGAPTLVLSLGGWILALRRRPAWTLLLAAMLLGYYFVSVRAMLSLSIRYLLPIAVLSAMTAGIALIELAGDPRRQPVRTLVAALFAVYVFAYGWDINRMMTGDGRYAAEAWLSAVAKDAPSVEIYQSRTYLPRFPEGLDVREVPFDERTTEAFAARRPDLVVISSSGIAGVTVRYKEDWQQDAAADEGYTPSKIGATGDAMTFTRDANVRFLDELRAGRLGYTEAARYGVKPWIPRPLIQSLNPEITIYTRNAATGVPAAEQR